MHQVGFIYKIIQRCTVNKTLNLAKFTVGGTAPLGYTGMMRINSSLCTAACQHTMFIPVMSSGKMFSNDFVCVCVCVCVVIFFTCEKIRMLCLVAVGLNIKMRCTHAVS